MRAERKNGSIVDTLAKAYFDSGDAAKAVEEQERAIRLTKEDRDPSEASTQEVRSGTRRADECRVPTAS